MNNHDELGNKSYDIIKFGIFAFLLFTYCQFIVPELRYLKYALPIISLIIYAHNYNKNTTNQHNHFKYKYLSKISNLYIICFSLSFFVQLSQYSINNRFFANFYFILAPILTLQFLSPYFNKTKSNTYFTYIFWGSCLGFLLERGSGIVSFFTSPSSITEQLLNSEASTESHIYPFIFSFFLLYSLVYGLPKKYILVSILIIILGFKRIVFLGLFTTLALYFLTKKKEDYIFVKYKNILASFFVMLSFSLVYIYINIANGNFDSLIYSTFGLSTNQLLMGRQYLYYEVLQHFKEENLYLGLGIGEVDSLLRTITSEREMGIITNLHSEILRLFLEMGSILFIIWLFIKVKLIIVNKYTFLSFTFLFLSLISDNILIYYECTYVFYFLILLSFNNSPFILYKKTKVSPLDKHDLALAPL